MTVELDFICDTCGRLVDDHKGSLYVSNADIIAARSSAASPPVDEDGRLNVLEMLLSPSVARWHIHHDVCRPDDCDGYDIDVEQVRTWRGLCKWTAHLLGKTWLPSTNWAAVLGNAAEERDGRIVPAKVRGDAA